MSKDIKALVARQEDDQFSVAFENLDASQLGEGDVSVELEYSTLPSNSANNSDGFFPRILTRTLRRPRWAIPMTISWAL